MRLCLAAAALICSAASAHDFWIEPTTFHPTPGIAVGVGLRVGEYFIGDPVRRQSAMIDRFLVRQADGEQAVGGADNIDPAGFLRADGRETAVIGYSGGGAYLEMPPDKFVAYLRLYGLDDIVADRARRGESDKPGRERFHRCAKSLLTGGHASTAVGKALGFTYEIVPDEDPTVRFAPFHGHLLFEGKPLADAVVGAYLQGEPSLRLSVRSGPDGDFVFDLPKPGVWLIRSVHMARAGLFSRSDWESQWASLTFDLPEPGR